MHDLGCALRLRGLKARPTEGRFEGMFANAVLFHVPSQELLLGVARDAKTETAWHAEQIARIERDGLYDRRVSQNVRRGLGTRSSPGITGMPFGIPPQWL
jgi:hypothetical protein